MDSVKAWEERITIPTYPVGEPNKNPMFLEKRVYQGSSGVVYPHAVIDRVFYEKEDKEYIALYIENEFLKVMVLPEIGGRIQMAYDKTNDYHFIYYNPVIKPALVGLTGPWISGGIEFNWPQHHRPSSFNPVDYMITENPDGSKTIWVNETEIMFHTKGMAGYTLYPGKAYIEVTGKLYNRTSFPQTFLWWANPAVEVDEFYQSVFPPDVTEVYDHGKRDVSSFPIATGTYYKVDYSPGTDISRFKNIPVPTSYMAVDSKFDFVGGYHHQKKAGMLHVADHHISPGKKQWTWGCGDFGKTWYRHLTDADGKGEFRPYFEIMTGVYTDNQPDFGWIMPNEERTFNQYFFPYKEIGYVKNASKEVAVNLEVGDKLICVKAYATSKQNNVRVLLKNKGNILIDDRSNLSPTLIYSKTLPQADASEIDLSLELFDEHNKLMISYRPVIRKKDAVSQPAKGIGQPNEIRTTEDLYLAGLHLEQFRHATFSPVSYYEEGLLRDPDDIRCNNALGLWYLKHGQFAKSEKNFRNAIRKQTLHNPNPYDGEPYYNLGLSLSYLGRWDEAYDAFYKSAWNAAWQDNAYLQVAYIDCRRRDFREALNHVEHSLARNYHGIKARHLKAVILRKLAQTDEAIKWIKDTLFIDPFDFGSRNELIINLASKHKTEEADAEKEKIKSLMRNWEQSYIEIGIDYAHGGFFKEAAEWLQHLDGGEYPIVQYYLAYYFSQFHEDEKAQKALNNAFKLSPDGVFPNRLEDIVVLQFAIRENPDDYKVNYYLGNLWYDKRQYDNALRCWELSAKTNDAFPTSHRNLGIAYYNKFHQPDLALQEYEKAFANDPADARVLFELDQLYKIQNKPLNVRLTFLQKHLSLVEQRDDLYVEYVTLHNLSGLYQEALQLLERRYFHPWEGGEGKVSKQYVIAKVALAKIALKNDEVDTAIKLLEDAQQYPENLGEGKLYGAQENNIFYWMGCAYEAKSKQLTTEEAAKTSLTANDWWEKASLGMSEPVQALYYNDQDPSTIFYQGLALLQLGHKRQADDRFKKLVQYGGQHLNDTIKTDYFAVSLPELSVFEINLNERNHIHCNYLLGLGYLGLNEDNIAQQHFQTVLAMNACHQGAKEWNGRRPKVPVVELP